MAIAVNEINNGFVGEVSGIDLTRPLSRDDVRAIEDAIAKLAVLVFHDQMLTDEQQIDFSRNFGEIEVKDVYNIRPERRAHPLINDISNLDNANKPFDLTDRRRYFNLGNQLWHSDSSFHAIPATYSMLSAREIPGEGGNTEFADMRAAYDALDDRMKATVEELICEHSLIFSRGNKLGFAFTDEEAALMKPVRQVLVRTHPLSGRKSLFLSSHAGRIVGWPEPEARLLLMNLTEFATDRRFVYEHVWRVGDLVMWDNRATMHRGRGYDETQVRDMRRTTVAGDSMTTEQVAV